MFRNLIKLNVLASDSFQNFWIRGQFPPLISIVDNLTSLKMLNPRPVILPRHGSVVLYLLTSRSGNRSTKGLVLLPLLLISMLRVGVKLLVLVLLTLCQCRSR